jgi:osmoprotectant transport system substrate-binding protein
MSTTKRLRLLLALVAALALFGAACGDDDGGGDDNSNAAQDEGGAPDGPAITIGAQDFSESAILSEIYRQRLEAEGFEVEIQTLGGFRDIEIGAFDGGDINFAPEYAASMLEFLNENAAEATNDATETVEKLQGYLDEKELTALEPSDAQDRNQFVVTEGTSEETGLESLSDLSEEAADITVGGPSDCETNAYCLPGLQRVYGADLTGDFTALDSQTAIADALEAEEIDVGVLFSTTGELSRGGFVVLDDDREMLAADNVVPVVTNELVEAYGDDLATVVNEISATLTTEHLIELNKRADIDLDDPDVIATEWLEENDLA